MMQFNVDLDHRKDEIDALLMELLDELDEAEVSHGVIWNFIFSACFTGGG